MENKKIFEIKIIEWLIFRYFNISNFGIPEDWSFYISFFQILTRIRKNQ